MVYMDMDMGIGSMIMIGLSLESGEVVGRFFSVVLLVIFAIRFLGLRLGCLLSVSREGAD